MGKGMEGWKVGRLEEGKRDGWKVGRLEGWRVGRREGWKGVPFFVVIAD